jgi:hypothetical protein
VAPCFMKRMEHAAGRQPSHEAALVHEPHNKCGPSTTSKRPLPRLDCPVASGPSPHLTVQLLVCPYVYPPACLYVSFICAALCLPVCPSARPRIVSVHPLSHVLCLSIRSPTYCVCPSALPRTVSVHPLSHVLCLSIRSPTYRVCPSPRSCIVSVLPLAHILCLSLRSPTYCVWSSPSAHHASRRWDVLQDGVEQHSGLASRLCCLHHLLQVCQDGVADHILRAYQHVEVRTLFHLSEAHHRTTSLKPIEHLVLFGMQNRTFGPYLAGINRILIASSRHVAPG